MDIMDIFYGRWSRGAWGLSLWRGRCFSRGEAGLGEAVGVFFEGASREAVGFGSLRRCVGGWGFAWGHRLSGEAIHTACVFILCSRVFIVSFLFDAFSRLWRFDFRRGLSFVRAGCSIARCLLFRLFLRSVCPVWAVFCGSVSGAIFVPRAFFHHSSSRAECRACGT